jgi:MFS family permease
MAANGKPSTRPDDMAPDSAARDSTARDGAARDSTAQQGTIRAALGYRDFRILLAGLAVSQLGDWLYNVALVAFVYQRTGSAMWAGVTTVARIVPMVVLGPLGGLMADRFGRRGMMIACDLMRAALMLALALVVGGRLPVVLAPVIAALATAAAAPYLPSVAGTTPKLVADADLPGANAARSAVTAATVVAGPALGGLLLFGSPALAFAGNAVTFGVSALCVMAIRARGSFAPDGPARPGDDEPGGDEDDGNGGLTRQLAEGISALRAHPVAMRLVGADIVCSLVYGMQTVLFVLVAGDRLGLHGYGYLFAAMGAGGLAGAAMAGRAARLPYRPVLTAALALVGTPLLLLSVVHWGPAIIVLAGLSGVGAMLVEVMTETGLQRMVPPEVFGRAYGIAIPASIAAIGAGALIAPALVSAIGLTGALAACGASSVAYCGLLLRPMRSAAPQPQRILVPSDR